jgi:hypothetical protein
MDSDFYPGHRLGFHPKGPIAAVGDELALVLDHDGILHWVGFTPEAVADERVRDEISSLSYDSASGTVVWAENGHTYLYVVAEGRLLQISGYATGAVDLAGHVWKEGVLWIVDASSASRRLLRYESDDETVIPLHIGQSYCLLALNDGSVAVSAGAQLQFVDRTGKVTKELFASGTFWKLEYFGPHPVAITATGIYGIDSDLALSEIWTNGESRITGSILRDDRQLAVVWGYDMQLRCLDTWQQRWAYGKVVPSSNFEMDENYVYISFSMWTVGSGHARMLATCDVKTDRLGEL